MTALAPVTDFLAGRVRLHAGDCLDVIRAIPDASIDSIVTDPPYALVSITRRFGKPGSAAAKVPEGGTGAYARASAGFMGKAWDTGERAFAVEFWAEALRVLKPGGHVVAFGGTRTYHRLACAIEDAGFEIRDLLSWIYGSGFPKSHNQDGDWEGWGTALKPALEPIAFARRPLVGTVAANLSEHGVGALHVDACRIQTADRINQPSAKGTLCGASGTGWDRPCKNDPAWVTDREVRARAAIAKAEDLGRWPANVLHDSSDEVEAAFAAFGESKSSDRIRRNTAEAHNRTSSMGKAGGDWSTTGHSDAGSAARFFYSAKADADDRIGSKHPTVKPVDLMRWLCRLVTPPGGTILDPFAGTGTTGEAAYREGSSAVLIEREAEYRADIARRMSLVLAGPDEKRHAILKARGKVEAPGGLFAALSIAAE